jgi:RHS repeat-associated protein
MPTSPSTHRHHYYPFGSSMKLRSYSAGSGFRFGFNGKEKENNIVFNEYTFEFRIYNSGIGRFFSTDPDMKKYPWQTSYAYYSNSPIYILDYLGLGQPGWMSENSRKNKREIKKFRRMLNKEDRRQMDKIEKMTNHLEKTKAVDNFISEINDKYKLNPGLYRLYNDDKSTGHNVIMSMTNIWAYSIDRKRSDEVILAESNAMIPLNWELVSSIKDNNLIYRNNSGRDGYIQIQFSAIIDKTFCPVNYSVRIKSPESTDFENVIDNITVIQNSNSQIKKVPKNAEVQQIIIYSKELGGNTFVSTFQVFPEKNKNGKVKIKETERDLGSGILTTQTISEYINKIR